MNCAATTIKTFTGRVFNTGFVAVVAGQNQGYRSACTRKFRKVIIKFGPGDVTRRDQMMIRYGRANGNAGQRGVKGIYRIVILRIGSHGGRVHAMGRSKGKAFPISRPRMQGSARRRQVRREHGKHRCPMAMIFACGVNVIEKRFESLGS